MKEDLSANCNCEKCQAASSNKKEGPQQKKLQSILEEAQSLVHGDRNASYGHPLDDFARTAQIWNAILGKKLLAGCRISAEDVALCMVGVKISREVNKSKRDNRVDGAGYFEALQMVIEEKERRNEEGL
jgi:hypothetical protein